MKRSLVIGVMWSALMSTSFAQGYPNKPIRFIVPFPPGGGTDLIARTLGVRVAESLGQQIVVDNRPGAQGNIGTAQIAKAVPDGYTIGLSYMGTFAINPFTYKDVGFDALKDFSHVTLATTQPYVVVVNNNLPVKSLKEMAELGKTRSGGLTFATSAAAGQVAGELFKLLSKTNMVHVPYKGAGPAVVDVVGGSVDLMIASPAGSVPLIKDGKLRGIAVTGATRLSTLPNVPTSRESGYPDFEMHGWYGIVAPAKTPKEIIMRLHKAYADALAKKETQDYLLNESLETRSNTPEEMTAFVKSEFERWGKVVRAANMRAE